MMIMVMRKWMIGKMIMMTIGVGSCLWSIDLAGTLLVVLFTM